MASKLNTIRARSARPCTTGRNRKSTYSFHTWKVVFFVPPLWILAAVLMKRDRNALRVLHVLLRLTRLWVTAHRWGGFSVSPPDARSSKGMT